MSVVVQHFCSHQLRSGSVDNKWKEGEIFDRPTRPAFGREGEGDLCFGGSCCRREKTSDLCLAYEFSPDCVRKTFACQYDALCLS